MSEDSSNKVNEPSSKYESGKKITFFNSLDEQSNYHLMKMAMQTPEENMAKLEELRKIFLKEYLNPNGTWKPMEKVFRMREPFK